MKKSEDGLDKVLRQSIQMRLNGKYVIQRRERNLDGFYDRGQ